VTGGSDVDGHDMCLYLAVHGTPPERLGNRFGCNSSRLAEPRGSARLDLAP
jgi:hypothetical protein